MAKSIEEFLSILPRFQPTEGKAVREYQVRTAQYDVGTTPVRILLQDPQRVSWRIVNMGSGRVFIGWTGTINPNTAWPLFENGGGLATDLVEDRSIVQYALWAVSQTGTNRVAVIEVVALT